MYGISKRIYFLVLIIIFLILSGCTTKTMKITKNTWIVDPYNHIECNNEGLKIVDPTNGGRRKLPILNETIGWNRTEKNVLTGFLNMYQAEVIYEEGEEYPYKMWFFGWATKIANGVGGGADAIFYARGKDLDTWEVLTKDGKYDSKMNASLWKPVISPSDKWYDNWHNGDPTVVKKDGIYYMAYSAYGTDKDGVLAGMPGDTDGDIMCIMGATSTDGIKWVKTDYPLLIWEDEIGIDETKWRTSSLGTKFYGDYHRPSIMYEDEKWKMYFDYWSSPNGICMGYAENSGDFTKGIEWNVVRAGDKPLIKNWPNPDVVKIGSIYYSYSDPQAISHGADSRIAPSEGWPARQIVEAQSKNGIDWVVTGWFEPDSDTPANQIPQIFLGKDKVYIFYATQRENDYMYFAIRYMERDINDFEQGNQMLCN